MDAAEAERNVHAPPTAEVAPVAAQTTGFYVVAPKKFLLLFLGTVGVYQLYWFHRHWRLHRARHGRKLSPVARALFSIFFAHGLTSAIDAGLRKSGTMRRWSGLTAHDRRRNMDPVPPGESAR